MSAQFWAMRSISICSRWFLTINPRLDILAETARKGRSIVDSGEWSAAIEAEWYELNWVFHRAINIAASEAPSKRACGRLSTSCHTGARNSSAAQPGVVLTPAPGDAA